MVRRVLKVFRGHKDHPGVGAVITSSQNTAVGDQALLSNNGRGNTATGVQALFSNTTGNYNTAVGDAAMTLNTTGSNNSAFGDSALHNNTIGFYNTANGLAALGSNTIGSYNTATGSAALVWNTTGSDNTANGMDTLESNTTGSGNTAVGGLALQSNDTGSYNTATGERSMVFNTTGWANTANGVYALINNTTGHNNTALGVNAGIGVTTANNVICIGANVGGANVSNTAWIGNVRGVTTQNANAVPVLIDSAGQLGTLSSSRRYKTDIKPMDKASEAILALKPVSFRYKVHKDTTPQFGLIAEEVAEVNPDLVVRDENGEIYTVRYDAVNAMLLNEFLKEHRKVEEQQATITQLKKDFGTTSAQLTARLDEQAAQIQKVSAQLEASKPAPQVVNNP